MCGREKEGYPHPVDPETEEAIPRPKIATCPKIEAARSGGFHHERRHRHCQGHDKEHRCQQPERDGTWSGMCCDRNPARRRDAGYGEQREVAQPEFTFQRWRSLRFRLQASMCFILHSDLGAKLPRPKGLMRRSDWPPSAQELRRVYASEIQGSRQLTDCN